MTDIPKIADRIDPRLISHPQDGYLPSVHDGITASDALRAAQGEIEKVGRLLDEAESNVEDLLLERTANRKRADAAEAKLREIDNLACDVDRRSPASCCTALDKIVAAITSKETEQ